MNHQARSTDIHKNSDIYFTLLVYSQILCKLRESYLKHFQNYTLVLRGITIYRCQFKAISQNWRLKPLHNSQAWKIMLECLFLLSKQRLVLMHIKMFTAVIRYSNQNERKTCLLNTKHFEFYMKSFPRRLLKASVNSCGHTE